LIRWCLIWSRIGSASFKYDVRHVWWIMDIGFGLNYDGIFSKDLWAWKHAIDARNSKGSATVLILKLKIHLWLTINKHLTSNRFTMQ
jgi:hypothetical protein